jgi:predicted dehydrogenase
MRSRTHRRTFLLQTAGTAAAASSLAGLPIAAHAHVAGSDTLKIGLVGCGGRGTGAAEQALTAHEGNRLVALADAFADRLEDSLSTLKGSPVGARVEVNGDGKHVGFDAYKAVIDASDVVLLATPPGFRPIHFAYAVEKGKHAFVEKPMAVDGPGLRTFLDAAKASKDKGLCVAHGFCWRYHVPRRETMARVHDGAIGEIVAVETTYNSQGVWDPRRTRDQCANEMEYQMRNWYYYDWLSGDHIVEQAVHGLDTMGWALGDKLPERCWGVGGRQARTDAKYGNIWDHFSVVYEYPEGVRGYHHCRHWPDTPTQTRDYILGARGQADVFGNRISGPDRWRFRGGSDEKFNMYQAEHDELFDAIRSGKPLNNAEQSAYSTLLAIMGRMACYTGQVVTAEAALASQESLVPGEFAWGDAPRRPVPVPGVTKLV